MSKEELSTINDIVNILDDLGSLDSFWCSHTLEIVLDNLRQKYLEYEDEEFPDDSEKLISLKSQVVEWVAKNDGIIKTNGEYFNLVKEFDYWTFGKINTDNLETAKKIIILMNKLYKINADICKKQIYEDDE